MFNASWTATVQAISAILTPLLVAAFAFYLTRRQNRSTELLKARVDYYNTLAPDLNTLMCYMTFIGPWRDIPPPEIIALKRRLDHNFHCAAPLFSAPILTSYDNFMRLCFTTFREWGRDPGICSNAYRRRQAWCVSPPWDPAWDDMFVIPDTQAISKEDLGALRKKHDQLLADLVADLNITRARSQYNTDLVSLNAHAPKAKDIAGQPPSPPPTPTEQPGPEVSGEPLLGHHPFTESHSVQPFHSIEPHEKDHPE